VTNAPVGTSDWDNKLRDFQMAAMRSNALANTREARDTFWPIFLNRLHMQEPCAMLVFLHRTAVDETDRRNVAALISKDNGNGYAVARSWGMPQFTNEARSVVHYPATDLDWRLFDLEAWFYARDDGTKDGVGSRGCTVVGAALAYLAWTGDKKALTEMRQAYSNAPMPEFPDRLDQESRRYWYQLLTFAGYQPDEPPPFIPPIE